MKKSFLYAAAAVAVLASCSNEDVATTTPGGVIDDNAPVKVELGVNTRAIIVGTRGTGTVGSTGDDNAWAGQKVNVFMLKKDKMELAYMKYDDNGNPVGDPIYEDVELLTPGAAEFIGKNVKEGLAYDSIARYYPLVGTFDFWGYRADDAVIPANNGKNYDIVDNQTIQVRYDITGTQDLMTAVTDNVIPDIAVAKGVEAKHLYGAYAARREAIPNLVFQHHLTRLAFQAVAGNKQASASADVVENATTDNVPELINDDLDGANLSQGVFIDAIKIYSRTTGALVAAYVPDYDGDKIIWDNDPADIDNEHPYDREGYKALTLMKRGEGKTAADPIEPTDIAKSHPVVFTDNEVDPLNSSNFESIGEALLVSPEKEYQLVVDMHQYKPKYEEWYKSGDEQIYNNEVFDFKSVTTPLKVKLPNDQEFLPGYTYNIKLVVWGLEKIEIQTTLTKWEKGDDVKVDME